MKHLIEILCVVILGAAQCCAGVTNLDSLTLSDDLIVGDNATITGDATVGGTFGSTGAVTVTGELTADGEPIIAGPIRAATAKTSDYTVVANDNPGLFSDAGIAAASSVTFTLPTAVAGYSYAFHHTTAATFEVKASTSDQLVGVTDGTGEKVQSVSPPAYIHCIALDATNWCVLNMSGTWADAN